MTGRKGETAAGWEDASCSPGAAALVTVEMAKAVVVGTGGRDDESSDVLKTRNDELAIGRFPESYQRVSVTTGPLAVKPSLSMVQFLNNTAPITVGPRVPRAARPEGATGFVVSTAAES